MPRERRNYDYSAPAYEEMRDAAERKSIFDPMFKDVKMFTPQQGANLIRILPQPKGKFGLTLKVHRNIGPKNRQYLCLRENTNSPYKRCPICEALYELGAKASKEDKMDLGVYENIVYYIIDRDKEKEGVQIWNTSTTNHANISAQCVNRRTQSVINITHPDDGYDVEFIRTGTTFKNTRYSGFQVMRESTPLSESEKKTDEWLEQVYSNTLPDVLVFYKPEHIQEVLFGKVREEEDDEPEEKVTRRRSRDEEEDENEDRSALKRTRTRLQEDLDDDVPFDSKANGKEEAGRRTRTRVEDEDEE